MEKKYLLGIGLLLVFLAIAVTIPDQINPVQTTSTQTQGLVYHGAVCIYKNGELIGPCKHNLLTTAGKNAIKDYIGSTGTENPFDWIAVANNSEAQVVGDTSLQGEWSTCGLAGTDGTFYNFGDGAWNISNEWTVSGCGTTPTIYVNGTGLYNASADTLFAENTFSLVTLQDGDKLNVTWGIWVT